MPHQPLQHLPHLPAEKPDFGDHLPHVRSHEEHDESNASDQSGLAEFSQYFAHLRRSLRFCRIGSASWSCMFRIFAIGSMKFCRWSRRSRSRGDALLSSSR